MRAFKCDKCGNLYADTGIGSQTFKYEDYKWSREHTKGYRVQIQIMPVNIGDAQYQGIELCDLCFNQLAITPLETLHAAVKLASDTSQVTKQTPGAKEREPLDSEQSGGD